MKKMLLISACLCLTVSGFAQEWDDDIYYNPKTAKPQTQKKQQASEVPGATIYGGDTQTYYYHPESTYQEMRDVDEYNRYGGYYQSAVDTIGNAVANSQDFTYTQEIQKYYNPTIVVDNMAVLEDVLDNSYGNINIVYDYGYPVFTPWYSYTFPYYGHTWCWNPYWNFGWGYGPGWSWSWGWGGWYDPWYAWGPGWYDPWWGWGPGWGPSYHGPVTPRPGNTSHHGWAHNTRPGTGTHRNPNAVNGGTHAGSGTRPGMASRPGSGFDMGGTRPGSTVQPGTSYTHRKPGSVNSGTTRPATGLDAREQRPSGGNYTNTRPATTTRPITTTRPSSTTTRPATTTRPSSTTTRPATTTRPSKNTTRPSSSTRPSSTSRSSGSYYNPGSSSSHRSSGGFRSGGGKRGGGGGMHGGGGGHRR